MLTKAAKYSALAGGSFFAVHFIAPEDRADAQLQSDPPIKNVDYLGMFFDQRASLAQLNGQGPVVPLKGRTVAPPLMTPRQMDAVVRAWEQNLEGAIAGIRDGSFGTIDVAEEGLSVALIVLKRDILELKLEAAIADAKINPLLENEDEAGIRGIIGSAQPSFDVLVLNRIPIPKGPNIGINAAPAPLVAKFELVIKKAIFELQSLELSQAVIDKVWEGWSAAVVAEVPNIAKNTGEFLGKTLAVGGTGLAIGIGQFLGSLLRELALPIAATVGGYVIAKKTGVIK